MYRYTYIYIHTHTHTYIHQDELSAQSALDSRKLGIVFYAQDDDYVGLEVYSMREKGPAWKTKEVCVCILYIYIYIYNIYIYIYIYIWCVRVCVCVCVHVGLEVYSMREKGPAWKTKEVCFCV